MFNTRRLKNKITIRVVPVNLTGSILFNIVIIFYLNIHKKIEKRFSMIICINIAIIKFYILHIIKSVKCLS